EVSTRIAGHHGPNGLVIYLDLGTPSWQVARIGPEGWSVIPYEGLPILFRRGKGFKPLPTPERGGSVDLLRPFVNVGEGDRDWRLLLGCIGMYFHPSGPYPILLVGGEQGSAKTTLSRIARELVDPNAVPLRSEPKEERDLMISATKSRVLAF